MTLQTLQQRTHDTMRQASREYIRERITGQRREVRRETDAEIREAIGGTLSVRSLK
jgi:hypothetical protein